MQPVPISVGRDVLSPSPVPAALEAYLSGDLDACLATLDDAPPLSPVEHRETLLLRARVGLRRMRYADVITLLRSELRSFAGIDEACTARMLHGIAVARSGKRKRGLTLLASLYSASRTLRPHPTIRAEIAYWYAFASWLEREYDGTLRLSYVAEAANADIVSVRAVTLRGYVAAAKEQYLQALEIFRSAREKYRKCRERDLDLYDRIELQIASLEVGLYSSTVEPTRLKLSSCLAENTPTGAKSTCRLQTATLDAWLHAFNGDKRQAYHNVRIGEHLAPNEAWRVWGLANRSQLARVFGDNDFAFTFAAEALEIVDKVSWSETTDEERVGLLLLSEALSSIDPHSATIIFELYTGLTSTIDRALLFHDDVRLWILETFVLGLVERIRGNAVEAARAFRAVQDEAMRVGILWRATLALIELDATPVTVTAPDGAGRYLQCAALLVREHFPKSFLARRLGWWARAFDDHIAGKLSRQQREVLRHCLSARTIKETAAAMRLSEHTVKEYAATLFRSFGVRSKDELIVTCYERGIGSPEWWDALEDHDRPPLGNGRKKSAGTRGTRTQ